MMTDHNNWVPAAERKFEMIVSNSLFIVSTGPVFSVEQAKLFIQKVKKEHPNANHHVVAYIIGHGNSQIAHSTDDGEPSGTAGKPALAVLSGSGFGDIVVVVTRYFGGTKLGTGGLVRAYGDAVRGIIAYLPKAEKIPTSIILLIFPYPNYDRVLISLKDFKGIVLNSQFNTKVSLSIQLPDILIESYKEKISNITSGKAVFEIIEVIPDSVFPIK